MKNIILAVILVFAAVTSAIAQKLWAQNSYSSSPEYLCVGFGSNCGQWYNVPTTTQVFFNKAPDQTSAGYIKYYQRPI